MRSFERHAPLRAALRHQLSVSVAAMRDLGMADREVMDATSQARAALRPGDRHDRAPLDATPLIEAIQAQVRLSELVMRELGLPEREILGRTAPGRDALGA